MRPILVAAALLVLGAMTAGAHAETEHFVKAATFPGDGEGDTPPQAVFTPDTPKITLGVQLHDVDPGDKIKASWIAEKTTVAPANYEIDAAGITVDKDTSEVIAFRLSKPNAGWPPGEYRVDVSYNGGVELSQHFSIAAPR